MKTRVFLFDFDKTLTDEDSIFLLWEYAIKMKRISRFYYIGKMILGAFKYIFSLGNFKYMKTEMCSVLKYLSEEDLKNFVDYIYENHILKEGEVYFNNLGEGYKMLVSASPINYLKYITKYLNFDVVIGTELDENFKLVGENNKHRAKVKRIQEHLGKVGIEIDYEISEGYSDSYSADRPMLEMVNHRYLINSKVREEGYKNLSWS
ncbi:HAD family hydrolase [Anaerosphaera multitolerans]|uniref:Haloacid dehalogenase-like hydrolase n=1 Tax=Anaerosphaera multitolerans TaxID=2487351 RepID=A0A437S5R1_9FIRM|nr:HAD family hydrolase [Anaerosphaera multitolerans]RVU54318.1 haloacid dehalogenase-like hydrolase [Anaerosphaera multitolerans]